MLGALEPGGALQQVHIVKVSGAWPPRSCPFKMQSLPDRRFSETRLMNDGAVAATIAAWRKTAKLA